MVYLVSLLVLLSVIILLFMILRFVQPELIYIVRHTLIKVRAAKVFRDSAAYRFTPPKSFPSLLGDDLRYETRDFDEKNILKRVDKIRELYRVLVRRPHMFDTKKNKPQVCIVELAGLVGNLGRHMLPDRKFNYPTLDASALLAFIGNEMRNEKDLPPLKDVAQIEAWFIANPISIEQVIEILIAAIFGMAYRQRVQDEDEKQKE